MQVAFGRVRRKTVPTDSQVSYPALKDEETCNASNSDN